MTPFGAQIVRGRRITVEGPEEYIRFFVVYYLFELASTAMKRRIEPQLFGGNEQFFNDLIAYVERESRTLYTDNARHQLAVYLQIMVLRILKGKEVGGYTSAIPLCTTTSPTALSSTLASRSPPTSATSSATSLRSPRADGRPSSSAHISPPEARASPRSYSALSANAFGTRPPLHLEKPCAALIEAGQTHMRYERAISLPQENTGRCDTKTWPRLCACPRCCATRPAYLG